jgi:hypothetical protein
VVTVSSGMAARGKINFDDLQWQKSYDPTGAYAQSKLADLLLSQHLAVVAEHTHRPLISAGAHLGNAATNLAAAGPQMGRNPSLLFRLAWKLTPQHDAAAGATPIVLLATDPAVEQGGSYGPRFGLVGAPRKPRVPGCRRGYSLPDLPRSAGGCRVAGCSRRAVEIRARRQSGRRSGLPTVARRLGRARESSAVTSWAMDHPASLWTPSASPSPSIRRTGA